MNMHTGLEGFYTLRVRGPDGIVRRELRFANLILDAGLNGIGTNGTSWLTTAALGTGTAAPTPADTGLSSPVSTTTTLSGTNGAQTATTPRYAWTRWTKRFAQGTATGTWTEVGVGRTATQLWSRALILDGLGAPTSLSVAAIEFVDIEYELRVYPNETDVTGVKTIGGINTTYTIRPRENDVTSAVAMVNGNWMTTIGTSGALMFFNGALNANYIQPSGTSDSFATPTNQVAAYVNNSRTKRITYNSGISNGNLSGGVASIIAYEMYDGTHSSRTFKCGFSPPIAKTNAYTLSLTFDFTWGRRP